MVTIETVIEAIKDHLRETFLTRHQTIVVMGPELYNQLSDEADKMFVKKIGNKWKSVAGVDIVVKDRIPGQVFGVMPKACLDHIDDHVDELLEEIDDGPDWIQCDLCQHPLNVALADGDDLTCLWCGDVNDLEDIRNGGY